MPRPDAPWSGRAAARARDVVRTWLPAPCARCGVTITDGVDVWIVGHIVPRSIDPSKTWLPRNWQPEHRTCSDRSSQGVVVDKARRAGALAVLDYVRAQLDDVASRGGGGYDLATVKAMRTSIDQVRASVRDGGWTFED